MAIEYYNKALLVVDEEMKWTIYFNIAKVYDDNNELYKAIEFFSKAIKLNPYCQECYNERGLIHKNLNKIDYALSDFSNSIRLKPNSIAYFNRHLLYENVSHQKQKAIDDLKQALNLDAKFYAAYNPIIAMLIDLKQYDLAKLFLDQYTKNINEKLIYEYQMYLYANCYYYYKSVYNKRYFFKYFNDLIANYLNHFNNSEKIIPYDLIKNTCILAFINHMMLKNYPEALNTSKKILKVASLNNDQSFYKNIEKDVLYVKILMKENNKNITLTPKSFAVYNSLD